MLYTEPLKDARSRRDIRHKQKCNNGIRKRDLKQQLCLGSKETFYEALGQIIRLEIVKRTIGSSVMIQKMNVTTSWRSVGHSQNICP
jgi:hypothetical protein